MRRLKLCRQMERQARARMSRPSYKMSMAPFMPSINNLLKPAESPSSSLGSPHEEDAMGCFGDLGTSPAMCSALHGEPSVVSSSARRTVEQVISRDEAIGVYKQTL